MGVGEGAKGISKWLINFQIKTCKTETTVGDTVGLAPMLKSVKAWNREPEYLIWQNFS